MVGVSVRKVVYPGDRKEYFMAEKDVWKMFCTVARERKRREVEPVLELLERLTAKSGTPDSKEEKEAMAQLKAIKKFVTSADKILGKISQSEESKAMPLLLKMFG